MQSRLAGFQAHASSPVLVCREIAAIGAAILVMGQVSPALAQVDPAAGSRSVSVPSSVVNPRLRTGLHRIVQLNLKAANLPEVMKMLAEQAGANVIIASGVSGTVTIRLQNVSVETALDLVTRLNHLSWKSTDGNTIVVGTTAQIKDLTERHLGPVIIPLDRLTSADAVLAVGKSFDDVQALPEGGSTVVLFGPESDVEQAQKLVTAMDGSASESVASPVLITLGAARPEAITATLGKLYPRVQVIPQGPQQLLLTGVPRDVQNALSLIKTLDIPESRMPGVQTVIYESRFASVEDLIRILSDQVPQVTATPGPAPQFTGSGASSGGGVSSGGLGLSGAGAAGAAGGASSVAGASVGTSGGMSGVAPGGSASPTTPAGASGGGGGAAPRTSVLLLTGPSDAIETARALLSRIDVPKPSVRIEARVIDVNLDHTTSLGVSWSFAQGFTFGELTPPAASPLGVFPFKGGPLSRPNINATVDMLATDSHNKVLASPTITALSDEPSNIFIGDQVTYLANVDRTTNGAGVFNTQTLNVGISLSTLAHVSPDGSILLNLAPTVSVLTALAPGANGAQLPLIAQRQARTTMRVHSGQTIAIGGLIRDEDLTTMSRIPGLSQLPILGELFKHRQVTHHRSEVVIFVRATAISPEANAGPGSPLGGSTPLSGAELLGDVAAPAVALDAPGVLATPSVGGRTPVPSAATPTVGG